MFGFRFINAEWQDNFSIKISPLYFSVSIFHLPFRSMCVRAKMYYKFHTILTGGILNAYRLLLIAIMLRLLLLLLLFCFMCSYTVSVCLHMKYGCISILCKYLSLLFIFGHWNRNSSFPNILNLEFSKPVFNNNTNNWMCHSEIFIHLLCSDSFCWLKN